MSANALPAFLRDVPVIDGSISGVSAMPREADIAKIVGGNFFRVFRAVWGSETRRGTRPKGVRRFGSSAVR